jgi:predicted outer membrane repeat protein
MNTDSRRIAILTGLTALALMPSAAMAWVSVGSSPGFGTCTYTTIADALADGDNEIRILDNEVFEENLLITGSRTLRGGFTSCAAAGLNIQSGDNAEIDGSGSSVLPTVSILLSGSGVVTLDNLTITGGAVGVATGGSTGVLTIESSVIAGNGGDLDGAGLSVGNPGDTLQVVIRDSGILGNSTTGSGGGIYCNDSDGLIRLESGAVLENSADEDGGGVYAGSGCRFSSFAGTRIEDGSTLRGILSNVAGGLGGGVYADGGAEIAINGHLGPLGAWGNTTDPATVAGNTAQSGGGLYATGENTTIEMIDAVIRDNEAESRGGGVRLGSGASLEVDSSGADCWNGLRCSQWHDNRVDGGTEYGGHLYLQNASARIDRTHLTGARAELGTAIYALGASAVLEMEGSYLSGNGLNLPFASADYVIRLFDNAQATLLHVTVANNLSGEAAFGVSGSNSQLRLDNSIVFNGELPVVAVQSGGQADFDCVVANESDSTGAGVVVGDPGFRNSEAGDFRLSAGSTAIDRCADAGATLPDDEGQPRGLDDPDQINLAGPYDSGADEYRVIDRLFSDRFEPN